MDKLLVDFEADFENETGWSAGEYPSQEVVSLCWRLYRQSRASIVVELPDISDVQCQECADDALLRCEKRLRSIGLSIKGE
ncbi:hypothetical protein F0336_14190 [Serratia liquefaciens]|uniref:hypothetical protein n=1 Tax=Serratia liquefaciens TaxID=614 RepID=UPI0013C38B0D|nr:hypothetical protein [Serratia liquefaciens]QIC84883.1 hypothetical protein F0336_14190 [Serratia liquefaciens]